MKYSFCTTSYNVDERIGGMLDSILKIIPDGSEFIIVDNCSIDDTIKIVQQKIKSYPHIEFKIIVEKCSRGRGRQIALLNSSGDFYVYLDADCYYDSEKTKWILDRWNTFIDKHIYALYSGIFIFPREVLIYHGGFPDTNNYEDVRVIHNLWINDSIRSYPMECRQDWVPGYDDDFRMTDSYFEYVWRKILCRRDFFLLYKDCSIIEMLKETHCFSKGINFGLFWIPLYALTGIFKYINKGNKIDCDFSLIMEKECFIDLKGDKIR